jgi:hypothetical protein
VYLADPPGLRLAAVCLAGRPEMPRFTNGLYNARQRPTEDIYLMCGKLPWLCYFPLSAWGRFP